MIEATGQAQPLRSALIVDDDEFSREVLGGMLSSLGFTTISEAENGRVALRQLKQLPTPPDLLICDIFMPDMDGIEFLSELCEVKYAGKFALVSGVGVEMLAIARDVATAGQLKLVGSFIKPVDRSALAVALGITA